MRYILQINNGNAHVCEINDRGLYETIGFVAGDSNIASMKLLIDRANEGAKI